MKKTLQSVYKVPISKLSFISRIVGRVAIVVHGRPAAGRVQGGITTTQYAIVVTSRGIKGISVLYVARRIGIIQHTKSWYSVIHVQGEWLLLGKQGKFPTVSVFKRLDILWAQILNFPGKNQYFQGRKELL